MTLEIRPMGIKCNLRCKYCYQNYQRDAHSGACEIKDLEAFKERLNSAFTLFGGEPLLTPIHILEDLFKFGNEKFGHSGIQTNGTLITDEHIRIFKDYNVNVGISVDGDKELNDYRWAGSLEKTREMTKKTNDNIKKLINAGINVSIIATIHKANASQGKREKFKVWLEKMNMIGVGSIRLHTLEKDGEEADDLALSTAENIEAFKEFLTLSKQKDFNMSIRLHADISNLLQGKDNCVTCTWNFCDPWNTSSVTDLSSNGAGGCGRPHKDSNEWIKSSQEFIFARELILYQTPQEYGGCKGCKYFALCKGYCAGSGLDDDWRNRSDYCDMLKNLFETYEEKFRDVGIPPITDHKDLRQIEIILMEKAEKGERCSINQALNILRSTPSQGTVCRVKSPKSDGSHSDKSHADVPHGDGTTHGDHNDSARGRN